MDHQLTAFVEDLRSTHRGNLVSVILYGSAATREHDHRRSDYNLLVVLDQIRPIDLRNAHAAVREWAKLGHNVPLYFTADEIDNAVDVFPIEFHQMQNARKVLVGKDVLADIVVSDENLRHQVEFELRSKLLMLRRQYIPASESTEGLQSLMADSLISFISLFRGVLLVLGTEPPVGRRSTLAATIEQLGINGQPFEKIYNIRHNNFDGSMDEVESNELFADYMKEIERVIAIVDGLEAATA